MHTCQVRVKWHVYLSVWVEQHVYLSVCQFRVEWHVYLSRQSGVTCIPVKSEWSDMYTCQVRVEWHVYLSSQSGMTCIPVRVEWHVYLSEWSDMYTCHSGVTCLPVRVEWHVYLSEWSDVFALTPSCAQWRSSKHPFDIFGLTWPGTNPGSTILNTNMLIIRPLMWYINQSKHM